MVRFRTAECVLFPTLPFPNNQVILVGAIELMFYVNRDKIPGPSGFAAVIKNDANQLMSMTELKVQLIRF